MLFGSPSVDPAGSEQGLSTHGFLMETSAPQDMGLRDACLCVSSPSRHKDVLPGEENKVGQLTS